MATNELCELKEVFEKLLEELVYDHGHQTLVEKKFVNSRTVQQSIKGTSQN